MQGSHKRCKCLLLGHNSASHGILFNQAHDVRALQTNTHMACTSIHRKDRCKANTTNYTSTTVQFNIDKNTSQGQPL